jgi:hypothetical protein
LKSVRLLSPRAAAALKRRFRLIVDSSGTILRRSTLDFGARAPPASMQR